MVVEVLAVLLAAAPALPQPGAVSGHLEINGRRIELRYAYASAEPGVFDPSSEDFRVLLTDVALPPEDREDPFRIIRLAREKKLRGSILPGEPQSDRRAWPGALRRGGCETRGATRAAGPD